MNYLLYDLVPDTFFGNVESATQRCDVMAKSRNGTAILLVVEVKFGLKLLCSVKPFLYSIENRNNIEH